MEAVRAQLALGQQADPAGLDASSASPPCTRQLEGPSNQALGLWVRVPSQLRVPASRVMVSLVGSHEWIWARPRVSVLCVLRMNAASDHAMRGLTGQETRCTQAQRLALAAARTREPCRTASPSRTLPCRRPSLHTQRKT